MDFVIAVSVYYSKHSYRMKSKTFDLKSEKNKSIAFRHMFSFRNHFGDEFLYVS